MVIDEIFVKEGSKFLPIDSLDDQTIDEINLNGEICHFAREKEKIGVRDIAADYAVEEPIIAFGMTGNTFQQTHQGSNLFDQTILL